MNQETYRENFWKGLERAFADEDNARFDIQKHRDGLRRAQKRRTIISIVALFIVTLLISYFSFLMLFNLMPLAD